MTPTTGKRSYRACLRCRQRKTRCDLNKIGEPKQPPCVSCHHSGSECILTRSRRGGDFRHRRHALVGPADSISSAAGCSSDDRDSAAEEESSDVLNMELRNPSDALHILALSRETQSSSTVPKSIVPPPQDIGAAAATTIFDDYELVRRGLLRPSLIYELLLGYSRYYHPYCPIVPSYVLQSSSTQKIQRSDYFLLTAILTIASRDDPRHSLTHWHCWDYTQRLLVDVLLAHPWAQTPRTVEGLLLLAEWLPHIQIQETTSEAPKNLFSEDRTAWSLVGLAVRHGYLQRLDQAAFRNSNSNQSKERAEQNRLIWTYIWMADRQISVRLGQSFWSRGPSHTAKFTHQDFPTLQPCPENDNEDYASALQATMELIQILHNAHAILYTSKERTLAMVYEGHYPRYLDDFRTAATTWHSTWRGLAVSKKIKSTLLIMYEYICLYTNAFSFQAVLTRAADPRMTSSKGRTTKRPLAELLSNGIMSSPDGRFIFDAFSAASNLLSLMNGLDPQNVLRYLPSRYYLYGVYAAVLLHKADCAGAFHSGNQRQEIASLARDFISVLEKAPSTESHICHRYSLMLKQFWNRREKRQFNPSRGHNEAIALDRPDRISIHREEPPLSRQNNEDEQHPAGNSNPTSTSNAESFGMPQLFDPLAVENDMSAFPSIEGYFLGSFMPGVADFTSPTFDAALGQQYPLPGGVQDWGFGQPNMDSQGAL